MYLHGVLTGIGDAPLKTKKTTLDQGRENELVALQAIGTIGWLSTRQVGAWLYHGRPPHTATNKAARVLARLVANGEVKRRDEKSESRRGGVNFGIAYYVLTPAGAARADDEYCRPGLHLSQLDVGRQRIVVAFLTEIRHRLEPILIGAAGVRAGIASGILNKNLHGADALIIDPENAITAVLVVRNLHSELVNKAQRLTNASEALELRGDPWTVREFQKALIKRTPHAQPELPKGPS